MFSAIASLGSLIIGGVTDHFKDKRELAKAKTQAKIKRISDAQEHDQKWEIMSMEDRGWKDDILFYAIIALFVWAGFDPQGAKEYFENLKVLPEWFIEIFGWVVASVLGVKKIGDYLPSAIGKMKKAWKE